MTIPLSSLASEVGSSSLSPGLAWGDMRLLPCPFPLPFPQPLPACVVVEAVVDVMSVDMLWLGCRGWSLSPVSLPTHPLAPVETLSWVFRYLQKQITNNLFVGF